jgi:hypothetical protein
VLLCSTLCSPWFYKQPHVEVSLHAFVIYLYSIRICAYHARGYQEFWDVRPYSPLEVKQTFRKNISPPETELSLPPAFTLVSCFVYSSTLKMVAPCSSETSFVFEATTLDYIPEDRTLFWSSLSFLMQFY